jgi:RimJ/RimL family protein N-acetyltransferase
LKVVIETSRLFLRELTPDDKDDLSKVLSNNESMIHYPHPFSEPEVNKWIEWNIGNYKKYNYGLWAVIRKEDNIFLGDCGITMQNIDNKILPEVGFHIRKEYCKHGYATEAAKAVIKYGFNSLHFENIYSYSSINNIPSIRVMDKSGMRFIKHFSKVVYGIEVEEVLYGIDRETFLNNFINMV